MNVIHFRPQPAHQIDQMLDEAFEEQFEELIIIGFKGGQISIHHSEMNRARILGCLEMAKYDLLKEE